LPPLALLLLLTAPFPDGNDIVSASTRMVESAEVRSAVANKLKSTASAINAVIPLFIQESLPLAVDLRSASARVWAGS
jgi:hypothetical protein